MSTYIGCFWILFDIVGMYDCLIKCMLTRRRLRQQQTRYVLGLRTAVVGLYITCRRPSDLDTDLEP